MIIHQFFAMLLCAAPRPLRFIPYSWFFNRRERRVFKIIIHQSFFAIFLCAVPHPLRFIPYSLFLTAEDAETQSVQDNYSLIFFAMFLCAASRPLWSVFFIFWDRIRCDCPGILLDLRLTARFLPFSEEPPSFVFAALHGGFSSLLLKRSLREASLRLAHQKQASCLLLVCRLRSFSPPSVAAFPRYRSALSTVCESLDSHPSRSKPPACIFRTAFVRFRRPPWRLFLAIALALSTVCESLDSHPSRSKPPASIFRGRLRSFSPPSVAAFPRYRSALSSGGESTTRLPLPRCQNTHAA